MSNEYEYAERFLDQVPRKWTYKPRIDLDFTILETLVWAGKVKMAIRYKYGPTKPLQDGPAKVLRGSMHFFKRIA